jgi:predicted HTH transcriptional regulator
LAKKDLSDDEVLALIDYPAFFDLLRQPLPDNKSRILERLCIENTAVTQGPANFGITNLGALLFAKRLSDFAYLSRKAPRIIEYAGDDRVRRIKEHPSDRGYANGFSSLIEYINERLPMNEVIGKALRKDVRMYPELAVRELLANALVHQDLSATGQGPMVEILANRIEFTNPGKPLIDPLRFLDAPPRSRNELLAAAPLKEKTWLLTKIW